MMETTFPVSKHDGSHMIPVHAVTNPPLPPESQLPAAPSGFLRARPLQIEPAPGTGHWTVGDND